MGDVDKARTTLKAALEKDKVINPLTVVETVAG